MIYVAAGNSAKVERPYQALRLTTEQRETMTRALRDFWGMQAAEDEDIAKHQMMVHEALTARRFLRVPRKAFREALSVCLYQDIERNDAFTNPTEMSKARAYMQYHGLDPDQLEASDTESMNSDSIDEMYPNAVTTREMVELTAKAPSTSMQGSEGQTGETRLVTEQVLKDQSEQTVSSESPTIQPCGVAKAPQQNSQPDPHQHPHPQMTDHTPGTTQASVNPILQLAGAGQTPNAQPQEKQKRAHSIRKKPEAKATVKARKTKAPGLRTNKKGAESQNSDIGVAGNRKA